MDLEETEARNDCADEVQQQFNPPTELWSSQLSQLRVSVVRIENLVVEAADSTGTLRKWNVR
jgi:hypothetical protein